MSGNKISELCVFVYIVYCLIMFKNDFKADHRVHRHIFGQKHHGLKSNQNFSKHEQNPFFKIQQCLSSIFSSSNYAPNTEKEVYLIHFWMGD
jgi:hypothetical protein